MEKQSKEIEVGVRRGSAWEQGVKGRKDCLLRRQEGENGNWKYCIMSERQSKTPQELLVLLNVTMKMGLL